MCGRRVIFGRGISPRASYKTCTNLPANYAFESNGRRTLCLDDRAFPNPKTARQHFMATFASNGVNMKRSCFLAEDMHRCIKAGSRPALSDGRPLCAFRAAFGALMLLHTCRLHVHGMYHRTVLLPAIRFDYTIGGIQLVPWLPTSESGALCHLLLLCLSSLGIALGAFTRLCAASFGLLHLAFVLSDRTIFNNQKR
jgi:hypothetical protein